MYSLTGKWSILPGKEEEAHFELKKMAEEVQQNEPDTLLYMVHIPNFEEISLPPAPTGEVIFFEIYKDKAACDAHINGPIFQDFLKKNSSLFLKDFNIKSPQIYITVEIMKQLAGFARNKFTD